MGRYLAAEAAICAVSLSSLRIPIMFQIIPIIETTIKTEYNTINSITQFVFIPRINNM